MLIACGDTELNPGPRKGAPATILRADQPGNIKDVVVCVYFKESLHVRCLPNSYLKECLILEVSINNKKGYIVSLYRSPSETSDEFDSFITNIEKFVVDISRGNLHFFIINR